MSHDEPEHRGRGLGRRLLDRAIGDLTRRGARAIGLDGVPQAVRLYERAGFRKVCRVRMRGGRIAGYLLGRRWEGGCQAGPWIQEPGLDDPAGLALSIAAVAGNLRLSLGVLESNRAAAALARQLPLEERADPPWRMVRGIWPPAPRESWQVTIGSPAKG